MSNLPFRLQKPIDAPRTNARDIGFAIRDLLSNKQEFPTYQYSPAFGRYQEEGDDAITDIDAHDPNNLHLTTAKGQKFTLRITAN